MARYSRARLCAAGGSAFEVGVWRRLDGHPQRAFALDRGAVEDGAVLAAEDRRLASIGQSAGLIDVRDGADAGVLAVDARHQHDQAIGLAGGEHGGAGAFGFDGDRDGHVRQDDAIVERQQWQK